MDILRGIQLNFRGLLLGLRTPRLLLLGLLRFLAFLVIGVGAAVVFFAYHQDIIQLIWAKPESLWVLWLWYLAAWLLSLILLALTLPEAAGAGEMQGLMDGRRTERLARVHGHRDVGRAHDVEGLEVVAGGKILLGAGQIDG